MQDIDGLEERITRLLKEEMALDVPSAATDLVRAGYIDSLSLAQLLERLEAEFGFRVQIEDLDLDQLRSIGGIASFVRTRLVRAAAAGGGVFHGDGANAS